MEILSKSFRTRVLAIFDEETTVGAIGGLIFNKKHEPMPYNYGYFSNIFKDTMGGILYRLSSLLPFLSEPLTAISRPFTYNLHIKNEEPVRLYPDWISEAFFVIRGDVFREIGGFDSTLRYHEGQVLAHDLHRSGYKVMFWPEIHARHLEIHSRSSKKDLITNWFKLRQKNNRP